MVLDIVFMVLVLVRECCRHFWGKGKRCWATGCTIPSTDIVKVLSGLHFTSSWLLPSGDDGFYFCVLYSDVVLLGIAEMFSNIHWFT